MASNRCPSPLVRAPVPASVARALAARTTGARPLTPGEQAMRAKEAKRSALLNTFMSASPESRGVMPRATAPTFGIPQYGPAFARTGLGGLDRAAALRGLAALGDAAFQQAMSAGFDVNRQVQRLVSLQQRLYSRLANPGAWASTFNADEIALIRGDLDRWNNSTAANWWSSQTTSKVTQSKEDLEWWMREGAKVYDDAASIAERLKDTSLVSDLRSARQTFLNETQSALIDALKAVGAVGKGAITEAGGILKTGADAAGGILSSMAFRVVGIGVLALGGLALGAYLLKRGGLKANVAIPGLPAQVGVGGLRRRRRRRSR